MTGLRVERATARGYSGALHWAGYLGGFAFSGFFDGILLHQILQWHHLLSSVEEVGGLRRQILFDGLFHAAMYAVAAAALWLLWRARIELAKPGAGRLALLNALIGFGVWNILDAVLSHWLLAIHRVRLDTANPLGWDLIWFTAFGALPLLLGLIERRRMNGQSGAVSGRGAALGLAFALFVGGAWAAQPPPGTRTAIVVFRPDVNDGDALNAIMGAKGQLLWQSGGVWAVNWDGRGDAIGLYANGAMLVSSTLPGGGCAAWSRS